jgi:hypothetical protein
MAKYIVEKSDHDANRLVEVANVGDATVHPRLHVGWNFLVHIVCGQEHGGVVQLVISPAKSLSWLNV